MKPARDYDIRYGHNLTVIALKPVGSGSVGFSRCQIPKQGNRSGQA